MGTFTCTNTVKGARGQELRPWQRYAAIACISLVPLAVVGYTYQSAECVYFAAALLILSLSNHLKLALWLPVVLVLSTMALGLNARYLPVTYDAALWRLDAEVGFNPMVAIQTFEQTPLLYGMGKFIYSAYLLAIALACAASTNAERFCAKVVTACGLGYLLYPVIPACGPRYLLTSTVGAPRNAMPSLHLTWALLIRHEIRFRSLPVRLAGDVFVIFTAIATIGSGEHYLWDLVAAVPFALLIEWLFSGSAVRLNGGIGGKWEMWAPRKRLDREPRLS